VTGATLALLPSLGNEKKTKLIFPAEAPLIREPERIF